MRFDNFDLNLLVALQALLEERNVTHAAARLNLTQPAMSAALKKLRDYFQDELLVQQGRQMHPTQHALTLEPEVNDALLRLRSLLSTGTSFDPSQSRREFRIIASDYITTVLLVPVIGSVSKEAPHVRIHLIMPSEGSSSMIVNGTADLMISPEEFLSGDHPKELIFEERMVVVGCASNPALNAPLTMEAFMRAGHIAVRVDGRRSYIEERLAQVAPDRNVEVTAQSFIQFPLLIRGTGRLAVMPERLARMCSRPFRLKIVEAPFALSPMREMMMYHSARTFDEGLSWLRQHIRQAS